MADLLLVLLALGTPKPCWPGPSAPSSSGPADTPRLLPRRVLPVAAAGGADGVVARDRVLPCEGGAGSAEAETTEPERVLRRREGDAGAGGREGSRETDRRVDMRAGGGATDWGREGEVAKMSGVGRVGG